MPSFKTRRRVKSLNRGQTFKKNSRRSKSAEPYKNINAEKIGEGGFGIVSRPPARCAKFFSENSGNINQRNINSTVFQETYYKNPNYISKLGEYDGLKRELEIGHIVKDNVKYWRDYYCFTEFICDAPNDKHIRTGVNDYQDTYGIAPYCGITLKSIIDGKYHMSSSELCCLLDAVKQAAIGLGRLHRIYVYHQDIHDENILFNPEDRKLRWIDFGLATDHYDIKNSQDPIIISARMGDTEGLLFRVIKPTLEFIENRLKSAKDAKSKHCLDKVTEYLDKMPKELDDYGLPDRYRQFSKYMKEILRIQDIYVDFIDEFIGDLDENSVCKKNVNKK